MARTPPNVPPPQPRDLGESLRRNIEALEARRRQEIAAASRADRLADSITRFTGSMGFVLLHLVFYSLWIIANLGLLPGVGRWDPSFVILAMEASVEAIFLSTFVLISQNRSNAAASQRADLDLHISLLTEHEVTKLAQIVTAMAARLDVPVDGDTEINDVKKDVAPEAVLDEITARRAGA